MTASGTIADVRSRIEPGGTDNRVTTLDPLKNDIGALRLRSNAVSAISGRDWRS